MKGRKMEKEVLVAIIGSITTVGVAAGGWMFAWYVQKESKRREREVELIERLRKEVLARIELEEDAIKWLAELTQRPQNAVKLEVRERAEKRTDQRPTMSKSHKDLIP